MHLNDLHALLGSSPSSPRITEFLTTLSSSPSSSSSPPTPPPLLEPEIKTFPGTVYHNYYDLGISFCYIPDKSKGGKGKVDPTVNGEQDFKLDEIDIYNNVSEDPSSASASASRSGSGAGNLEGTGAGIGGKAARVPKPTFKTFKGLPIEFPLVAAEDNKNATGSGSTERAGNTSTSSIAPQPTSSSSTQPPSTPTSHPFPSLNSETTGRTLVQTLGEPTKKGGGSGIGPFMQGIYLEWFSLGVQVDLEAGKDDKSQEGGVWERAAGWGWVCLKVFEKGG